MTYVTKLKNIISKNNSNLVIGLDPDINKIPSVFKKFENPVFEFCKTIIESTSDIVAGYKLNTAFFEADGWEGMKTLGKVVEIIPNDLIKICDAKRGDIENTALLYSKAYLENYKFDSITLSPYMGLDSITPFLQNPEKGIYVLVLTSDQGSNDFQYLYCGNKYLYEIVADKCLSLGNGNTGFVVGANHTNFLMNFTKTNPQVPLLIPGIGAQGNDLEKLLNVLHTDLFLINSSRGIIYSAPPDADIRMTIEYVVQSTMLLNNKINSGDRK